MIKEVQEYRYDETERTIITYDPITYEEIIHKQKCFDKIKTGTWKWYNARGKIEKEEDYNK